VEEAAVRRVQAHGLPVEDVVGFVVDLAAGEEEAEARSDLVVV
jgi:hypothetical protein